MSESNTEELKVVSYQIPKFPENSKLYLKYFLAGLGVGLTSMGYPLFVRSMYSDKLSWQNVQLMHNFVGVIFAIAVSTFVNSRSIPNDISLLKTHRDLRDIDELNSRLEFFYYSGFFLSVLATSAKLFSEY